MKNKHVKITIFMILLGSAFCFVPNNRTDVQAATGIFVENFSTTTYHDIANTNATGWGTGIVKTPDKPNPELKGIFNNSKDPVDVFVDGNYAYVAEYHGDLTILDISDPSAPTNVSQYIIGSAAGTPTGVYVKNSVCYVATRNWGLQIVDVSNPASPTNLSAYPTIDHPVDVYVDGDYYYVADQYGGVQIVDVTDPANPFNSSVINYGGFVNGVYISSSTLYIADYFGKFLVYDVTNPAAPVYRGNVSLTTNAYDLSVDGNTAYVANGWAGLVTIDVTNPTTPTILDTYNSGDYVKDAKFEEHKVYITDSASGVIVIDATNPSDLALIGSYDTWNWPDGLFVKDRMVYVADYFGGLLVLDHTGHESPMFAQSTTIVPITDDAQVIKASLLLNDYSTLWSGMAIGLYLSADGGANWQAVTHGALTTLTNPGKDLRFRLLLINLNAVNATWVSELTVEYTTKLESVVQDSPGDGSYITDTTPTLIWDPIAGAASYLLQVDDAPDFISQVVNASVSGTATNYTTTTLSDGLYHWRILAIDSEGEPGKWSNVSTFTLDTTDPVVVGEPNFEMNEGETGHNVNWTITEINLYSFTVYLDETAVPMGLLTWDGTTLWISTDGLGVGVHNYTLEAIDDAGNTGTDTVYVTVNIVVGEFNPTIVILPLLMAVGICSIFILKRRK